MPRNRRCGEQGGNQELQKGGEQRSSEGPACQRQKMRLRDSSPLPCTPPAPSPGPPTQLLHFELLQRQSQAASGQRLGFICSGFSIPGTWWGQGNKGQRRSRLSRWTGLKGQLEGAESLMVLSSRVGEHPSPSPHQTGGQDMRGH